MQQVHINTSYKHYSKLEELHENDSFLLQQARNILSQAYAPYSGFKVGAAVLLNNGEILLGCNQENAAYPMCLCAERVALAHAIMSFPESPVKKLAVTVKNINALVQMPASPCGACRQVILETELRFQQDITILMQGETGPIFEVPSGKVLLPLYFDSSFL